MMRTIQMAVACVAVLVATAGQVQAGIIVGVTATSDKGTFFSYPLPNLTNGVGLAPSISPTATHSNTFSGMWMNDRGGQTGSLTFDLGGTYSLSDIAIWQYQYNVDNSLGRGVQDFTLESSSDGTSYTSLLGTNSLTVGSGTPTETAQLFSLGGATANFVRLNYLSNYGDSLYTGLSEVQFVGSEVTAVPEPSSLALFGIGACVVGAARRRRR